MNKIKNNPVEQRRNDSIIFVPPQSPSPVIILDDSDDDSVANSTEYFNQELNIWIDMEETSEWREIDMKPDIEQIFNKLKAKYFNNQIDPDFKICHDLNYAICDGSAFKILERAKTILISQSILVRPRIQQISMILHILIHLFLNKASNGTIGISKHDENFRSIMHYMNERIFTNISFSHNFVYEQGEEDYCKQWWICTGVCQNYAPFRGIIRSPIMPNETMMFWHLHHNKCGGTFFKIFEIRKRVGEEVHKKYIRSPCYMMPQAKDIQNKVAGKAQQAIKNPIREQVDLTKETGSPIVRNLCDVIDLDDSQYNIDETVSVYLQRFIQINLSVNENLCPFCLGAIIVTRMAAHFDVCTGYQAEIHHCIQPFVRR